MELNLFILPVMIPHRLIEMLQKQMNGCLRSTWASEKPVKRFAVLITAEALFIVPQLGRQKSWKATY